MQVVVHRVFVVCCYLTTWLGFDFLGNCRFFGDLLSLITGFFLFGKLASVLELVSRL